MGEQRVAVPWSDQLVAADQDMGAHTRCRQLAIMAAQCITDGTMLGIRFHHPARGDQGAAAKQVQLLDQAVVFLLQPPIAGGFDNRGVERKVRGVVDIVIPGCVCRLHGVDKGLQMGHQRRRRDWGDDPAGHGEQRGAQVVDLGRGAVVDFAHEDTTVGNADDQAVALDGPQRLPHRATADAETGGKLGLVQPGALRDVASDDQPRDLLGD